MTQDPELLDAEPGTGPDGAPRDALGVVERAFAGRVVRTEGMRIEVTGPGGAVLVLPTPLVTLVTFRGVKQPLAVDAREALAFLTDLATGALVLVEEKGAGAMRRTHLVRVHNGKLTAVEDTSSDRADTPIAKGTMRVVSFPAGERAATPDEQRFIKKASGGLLGRMKRRVVEVIYDKTVDALTGAVENAVDNAVQGAQGARAAKPDDGRRVLPSPASPASPPSRKDRPR
jgi:hypothetical protein